jgi:transcriptional regulator with XRE-family HTH domain
MEKYKMQINTVLAQLSHNTSRVATSRGVSLKKLAKMDSCYVSESTLYRVKNASRTGHNPKLKTIVRVANALEIPVTELFRTLAK